MSAPKAQTGRRHAAPIIALLLIFALQLGYLAELAARFPDTFGQAPFCGVDAQAHWNRAQGMLDGTVPGDKVYEFIPLYPLYLISLNLTVGESYWLPLYIQAMFQLVGLAALYGLGRLLFSPLAGLFAMLGLGCYGYYLYYLPCFDQALLTTPALTVALFLVVKTLPPNQALGVQACRLAGRVTVKRKRLDSEWGVFGLSLLMGVAFTLTILSRPTGLMVLPLVGVWWLWDWRSWRMFSLRMLGLLIPLGAGIAPFTWHNYRVSGEFVLLSNNFGVNLLTGNNPTAHGLDSLAHAQSQPPVLFFLETIERVKAGQTTYLETVLHYWQTQPVDALSLTFYKVWLLFGETVPPLLSPYFPAHLHEINSLAWLPIEWQAAALVGLLGLLLVRPNSWSRAGFVWAAYAVFSLFTILFFVQLRFRLPLMPLVMLHAGALLALAPQWARQQPRRYALVLGAMLLLLPWVWGLSWFILGLTLYAFWLMKMKRENHSSKSVRQQLLIVAIIAYVTLIGGWHWWTYQANDVSQPIAHYLGPTLQGTTFFGQTMQLDCAGFNEVELTFGRFSEAASPTVTFHLTRAESVEEVLHQQTIEAGQLVDYQRYRLRFPPQADSAGQRYFIYLTSPEATADNAITVRGYADTPLDYYEAGQAFVGNVGDVQQRVALQADMAFVARCR